MLFRFPGTFPNFWHYKHEVLLKDRAHLPIQSFPPLQSHINLCQMPLKASKKGDYALTVGILFLFFIHELIN